MCRANAMPMHNGENIAKKIDGLAEKIGKRFDHLEVQFSTLEGRFDTLDGQVDFLGRKAVRFDEQLEKLERLPSEFTEFKERVLTTLDGHTNMLKNLDGERVASVNRFDRIEGEIDVMKSDFGIRA